MSMGDTRDHVIVKFWGAPYILTDDEKPIFKEPFVTRVRIPLQTDIEAPVHIATEAFASTLSSSSKNGLIIMGILRTAFSGVMQEVLGVMGFMQLVAYFPLIDVKFPPTAMILYK